MMPRKPTTEARLKDAREAAVEATASIRFLEAKRAEALLRDDDDGATKVLAEIERLRLFVRNTEEKAALLQGELNKETALRHAKEKEGLIGRIETKLTSREAMAEELTKLIGRSNQIMLELFATGLAVDAAWGWAGGDRHAILLLPEELVAALQHELFRQTAIPRMGGGQREAPHAGWKFPGAKPARLDLTHLPQKNPSLLETIRSANSYASDVMRARRPSTAIPFTVTVAAPEPRERTAAEVELAALLKRQAEMAADPALDDRAYADLIQQISTAQAAVTETEQTNNV
jgi:hypothetical protein